MFKSSTEKCIKQQHIVVKKVMNKIRSDKYCNLAVLFTVCVGNLFVLLQLLLYSCNHSLVTSNYCLVFSNHSIFSAVCLFENCIRPLQVSNHLLFLLQRIMRFVNDFTLTPFTKLIWITIDWCWYADMLLCWYFGKLIWWCVGILKCWYFGMLVCWYVGMLVYWYFGMLMCWYVGI